MDAERLKLSSVKSFVSASFFQQLSSLKLDEFKLDSTKREVFAFYEIKSLPPNEEPSISLSSSSFSDLDLSLYPPNSVLLAPGYIKNFNTIEEYKSLDKAKFLRNAGNEILKLIESKDVLRNPTLLNTFQIISFAELKKFKFFYWVAFPSFHTKWNVVDNSQIEDIPEFVLEWIEHSDIYNKGHFILKNGVIQPLSTLQEASGSFQDITVGFVDSSSIESKPSRFLNNYLALLFHYGFSNVTVQVFRLQGNSFELKLKHIETDLTKVTGWERTSLGKLGPKLADLSSLIDPVKLSEQSVDLNLKLMKWRVAPDINLDTIKDTKILLLGAGTLGSYVSRALLGWGVRNITFVDNGQVSHSNPVRQPLYNFEDVGKPKAQAAAAALKKIFPLVNSRGYEIEIPMAGHPVTDEEKQRKDFEMIEGLIDSHDAIFLLTDSRETRWLPTVIANVKRKIVINAALGFDGYLVMRHGVEGNLGCYFCNDVVAPGDSLSDRTLDQMCTVTRPGVALIASSFAAELLVSLLHHPKKHYAAANEKSVLGELPHQLRGFLDSFQTLKLQTPAYDYCSACSKQILEAYESDGWSFVSRALNDPKYLENVSGLTEVQRLAEEAAADFEENFSDEDW